MNITKIAPLSYGTVRRNKEVVDALTAPAADLDQRIVASIAFLKLGLPEATDESFDEFSPADILMAAGSLYKATFSRPEEPAPVPQT